MEDAGAPAVGETAGRHGLGPHAVGTRVVLRRLLPGEVGPSGGPAMTDVLGVLESWGGGQAVVRREDGTRVEVETALVVSGKPVPPRPSRHRQLDATTADRLAQPGWLPVDQEPLGDWLLRASGGFSSRGNSVLALGEPDRPWEQALDAVHEWYAARDLPVRLHLHHDDPLVERLTGQGWRSHDETLLMLASPAHVRRHLDGASTPLALEHRAVVDDGWRATDPRAARHGAWADRVLECAAPGGEVTLLTAREDGEVLARGRASVHGDWLGLSSLWTREDRRGAGLGAALLAELVGWGAERGATTLYLQVVAENVRARALYERLGLEVHHGYRYLIEADEVTTSLRAGSWDGTPGRPARDGSRRG